jgi:hypothetical protein
MFNKKDPKKELTKDLEKLLKEEGDFVQDLSAIATKGAEFHARLEAIEKALGSDPSSYSSKEADKFVQKASEKYSSELEKSLKQEGNHTMNQLK